MSRPVLVNTLRRALAHRYLPAVLAGVAMLALIPCLWLGRIGDDLIHWAWLSPPSQRSERLRDAGLVPPDSGQLSTVVMGLFTFADSGLDLERLIGAGFAPWWTPGETKLSFWRPLAALTHWVDYRLWPGSTVLMHAHSILWFGAAVFVITLLYRQLLTPAWIAGLAALFFALDESAYAPVASLANRNALMALFFGTLALLAHDRWRRHNSRVSAILSPFCLLLSLLSAEAGIATVAYLVAYALFLDRANWTRRALSVLPALIGTVAWRLVYSSLGYGVSNSGLYVDPIREPLRYIADMLERGPILLLGQWGLPSADVYSSLSDPLQNLMWFIALASIALVLVNLLPLLRKSRVARFWGSGMLLSVVPACAMTLTATRLLLFVSLGAMGLIGQFLQGLFMESDWAPSSGIWRSSARVLGITLIVLHGGVASAGRFAAVGVASVTYDVRGAMLELGSEPELENQTVVVVNSPSPFLFLYFPFQRAEQAAPLPRSTRILAPAFTSMELTRSDENTLVVRTQSSSLLSLDPSPWWMPGHLAYTLWRINDTFGAESFSAHTTERVLLSELAIDVTGVGEKGLPKEVTFRFAVDLEDRSMKWLSWDWQALSYVPFSVPPVGESVTVAGPF